MTRDSIPRDDLYGELEVSRQASVAAIEAAYRRLVKQHHPDVARSDDQERIKRLNLAREWLTDLDRRRRYDLSVGLSPTSPMAHHAPEGAEGASTGGGGRSPRASRFEPDASSDAARTFGVNANEVRLFLASLRGLDNDRARRVFDGRAVAHAKGYAASRRLAEQIGKANRRTEWQLAREAASVIARGKLGDTMLSEQIVDVLADAAGAVAIRDLLSKDDYRTLLLPWTWKSARVEGPPASVAAPTASVKATPPKPAPAAAARTGAAAAAATASGAASPAAAARTGADPAAGAAPAAATASAAAATAAVPAMPVAGSAATAPGPTSTPTTSAAQPNPSIATPAPASAGTAPGSARVSIADLGSSPWQRPGRPREQVTPARARSIPRPSVALPAASIPTVSGPSWASPRPRIPSWLPAAMGVLVLVVIAAALLGFGRTPADQAIAGVTDDPTMPTGGASAVVVVPGTPSDSPTFATIDPTATAKPEKTNKPGGNGPGPVPVVTEEPTPTEPDETPRATARPSPTPPPTATPSPSPIPTPTPTPQPTPSPGDRCVVPDFIGTRAMQAAALWADAGFTGPVTFEPQIPPGYDIGWQSLPAGAQRDCDLGITLRDTAP